MFPKEINASSILKTLLSADCGALVLASSSMAGTCPQASRGDADQL